MFFFIPEMNKSKFAKIIPMVISWMLALGKFLAGSHFFLASSVIPFTPVCSSSPLSPFPAFLTLSLPTCTWWTSFSPFLPSNTINLAKHMVWDRALSLASQFPFSDTFLLVLDSVFQTPRAHFLGMEQMKASAPYPTNQQNPAECVGCTNSVVQDLIGSSWQPQPSGKCTHQTACPSWSLKKGIYSLWSQLLLLCSPECWIGLCFSPTRPRIGELRGGS